MAALRHSFILLTLSCLLTACASSDSGEEPAAAGAMRFGVDAVSRAALTTSGNLSSHPFAVFGDMANVDDLSDDKWISVLNATEVRYDASAKQWDYDDTRYWFPGYQYSFVAVHPAGASRIRDFNFSDNQLKFTYTQPSDYKTTEDILVAAHRRNFFDGNSSPVIFSFSHILSNINIRVTYINPVSDAKPLIVNSVDFIDVPLIATYAITPAPLSSTASMTGDFTFSPDSFEGWTITDRGNLSVRFPDTADQIRGIPPDSKPHLLFSSSDALLLIPNPAAPTELTVSYTTYDATGSHPVSETFSIPQGWRPGMNYTLSFEITNGKTLFSVDVSPWLPGDDIEATVPRK